MNVSSMSVYWFSLPLAIAISLVYSASRYEAWPRIWRRASWLFVQVLVVMGVATLLLMGINSVV